jgi:signal transduction histidine kinase
VLFGIGPESAGTGLTGLATLARLQSVLLENYFLLETAERRLAERLLRPRRRGGTVVRQLERERQRVGRELHTGVGQMLAAIRVQLEVVLSQISEPPETVFQALNRIASLAEDALEQVRSLSRRLHPPEWQRLRLEEAIRQLWTMSGIPEQWEAELRIDELPRDPEPEIKALIYRSAQEALANMARHSHGTRAGLALEDRAGRVVLTVEDNGAGFDAAGTMAAPPSVAAGLGLRSIRDQAESAGAVLRLESRPGKTTLVVSAPYAPAES